MITDIKEYYRKNADEFGWGPKTAHLNNERKKLLDKWVFGKKVLDIGCGTGIYVDYLAKKGFDAVGVDFVKEFIDFAKKHRQGKFLVNNAYKLPFKDKSFDTVIMFDVLEHIEDELKVLTEIKRISKNRIILIVPCETNYDIAKFHLIYDTNIDWSHYRYYSIPKIKHLLNSLKIKIIDINYNRKIALNLLFYSIFKANSLIKKIIIKLLFTLLNPRNFYVDIVLIGEIT